MLKLLNILNILNYFNSELIVVLAPLVPIQTSLSLKIMFVNIVYTILWIVWLILSYYWLFAYQLAGGVSRILFYDLWYVGFNQNSENQPKQNDTRNFALNDIFRSSHGYHGLMSKKYRWIFSGYPDFLSPCSVSHQLILSNFFCVETY